MSDPYDIGFGVPPVYTGEWPPPSWADALAQHPALQPGLGVPTSTADAAMSPIPTSDMTPDAQHLAAAGGASPYSMPVGAPPMPNDQPGGLQVPPSPDAGPLPMPQMGPGAAMGQSTPQVDATSGAGEVNAPSLAQILKPQMDQRDPLAVTQADHDAAVEAESDRLANDPMALAQAQFRQQQLRENEEHIARLASDRKTIENLQAKADADAETKKQSDQVLNQAWALAHSKIDPEQWMKSRSLPQKLAAVVASVLGGLVAPQNGGRNIGLEIINKAVEENIAAQKDNLANGWKGLEMQKGAIADKRAADTAAFNNAESMRQATYQYTVNQIDDKIAALDPDSARAAKLGALKAQVLGQMAASHNAFTQQTFKNNLEIAKVRQEEIKQAEEIRKNKAAEALAWTKEGREGAAAKAAAAPEFEAPVLAAMFPGGPPAPYKMTIPQYESFVKTGNTVKEGQTKGIDVQQKQGAHSIPGLKLDNGQLGAGFAENVDDTGAEKLREEAAAVKRVVDIVDQMKAIRTGGSTKWGNSEEYQKLQSLGGTLKFALKDMYKVKNITDIDEKLFDKMLGFDDPTKFRSFKAGIDQFRSTMLDDINGKLHGHGVKGSIDVPEMKQTEKTPIDESMAFALQEPGGATPYLGIAMNGVHSVGKNEIINMQKGAISNLETEADDSAKRPAVEAALTKIAKDGQSEAVKEAAQSALVRLNSAPPSSEPEPEATVRP